jgi:hypothetical protein
MNKNIPFTQEQVASLKAGFTPSGIYPNRKARRKHLQKSTNNPHFGFHVHHYQYAPDNKVIGHLSIHATKGNW